MLLCRQPTSLAPVHSRCPVNNSCPAESQHSSASSACLFAADSGPIDSVSFFSPPPSSHSDSGSGSFQRLKAKLLESLCFYPPICSHLVGPGGGAAWALAMLEVPVAGESSPLSFPRSLRALGTDTRWGGQAPVKGEGASVSLLGEPQNLSALRDKMGRMLSKEGGIHSQHSQRPRIGPGEAGGQRL